MPTQKLKFLIKDFFSKCDQICKCNSSKHSSSSHWNKVSKSGPRKICGRQPLKNLQGYDLLKQNKSLMENFIFCVLQMVILFTIIFFSLSFIAISRTSSTTASPTQIKKKIAQSVAAGIAAGIMSGGTLLLHNIETALKSSPTTSSLLSSPNASSAQTLSKIESKEEPAENAYSGKSFQESLADTLKNGVLNNKLIAALKSIQGQSNDISSTKIEGSKDLVQDSSVDQIDSSKLSEILKLDKKTEMDKQREEIGRYFEHDNPHLKNLETRLPDYIEDFTKEVKPYTTFHHEGRPVLIPSHSKQKQPFEYFLLHKYDPDRLVLPNNLFSTKVLEYNDSPHNLFNGDVSVPSEAHVSKKSVYTIVKHKRKPHQNFIYSDKSTSSTKTSITKNKLDEDIKWLANYIQTRKRINPSDTHINDKSGDKNKFLNAAFKEMQPDRRQKIAKYNYHRKNNSVFHENSESNNSHALKKEKGRNKDYIYHATTKNRTNYSVTFSNYPQNNLSLKFFGSNSSMLAKNRHRNVYSKSTMALRNIESKGSNYFNKSHATNEKQLGYRSSGNKTKTKTLKISGTMRNRRNYNPLSRKSFIKNEAKDVINHADIIDDDDILEDEDEFDETTQRVVPKRKLSSELTNAGITRTILHKPPYYENPFYPFIEDGKENGKSSKIVHNARAQSRMLHDLKVGDYGDLKYTKELKPKSYFIKTRSTNFLKENDADDDEDDDEDDDYSGYNEIQNYDYLDQNNKSSNILKSFYNKEVKQKKVIKKFPQMLKNVTKTHEKSKPSNKTSQVKPTVQIGGSRLKVIETADDNSTTSNHEDKRFQSSKINSNLNNQGNSLSGMYTLYSTGPSASAKSNISKVSTSQKPSKKNDNAELVVKYRYHYLDSNPLISVFDPTVDTGSASGTDDITNTADKKVYKIYKNKGKYLTKSFKNKSTNALNIRKNISSSTLESTSNAKTLDENSEDALDAIGDNKRDNQIIVNNTSPFMYKLQLQLSELKKKKRSVESFENEFDSISSPRYNSSFHPTLQLMQISRRDFIPRYTRTTNTKRTNIDTIFKKIDAIPRYRSKIELKKKHILYDEPYLKSKQRPPGDALFGKSTKKTETGEGLYDTVRVKDNQINSKEISNRSNIKSVKNKTGQKRTKLTVDKKLQIAQEALKAFVPVLMKGLVQKALLKKQNRVRPSSPLILMNYGGAHVINTDSPTPASATTHPSNLAFEEPAPPSPPSVSDVNIRHLAGYGQPGFVLPDVYKSPIQPQTAPACVGCAHLKQPQARSGQSQNVLTVLSLPPVTNPTWRSVQTTTENSPSKKSDTLRMILKALLIKKISENPQNLQFLLPTTGMLPVRASLLPTLANGFNAVNLIQGEQSNSQLPSIPLSADASPQVASIGPDPPLLSSSKASDSLSQVASIAPDPPLPGNSRSQDTSSVINAIVNSLQKPTVSPLVSQVTHPFNLASTGTDLPLNYLSQMDVKNDEEENESGDEDEDNDVAVTAEDSKNVKMKSKSDLNPHELIEIKDRESLEKLLNSRDKEKKVKKLKQKLKALTKQLNKKKISGLHSFKSHVSPYSSKTKLTLSNNKFMKMESGNDHGEDENKGLDLISKHLGHSSKERGVAKQGTQGIIIVPFGNKKYMKDEFHKPEKKNSRKQFASTVIPQLI